TKVELLKTKFAQATGTVRGKEVNLSDTLAELLQAPAATARGTSPDSWPTLGGDSGRGRVPQAGGRPGARLVDVNYDRPKRRVIANPDQRAAVDEDLRQRREAGLRLSVIPDADPGDLSFQDNMRVSPVGPE